MINLTKIINQTKFRPLEFALIVTLTGLLPIPGYAQVDTVFLNVTGRLVGNTCNIVPADIDRTVTLRDVSTFELIASSDQSYAPRSFSLRLENCTPGITNAKFSFSGVSDSTDGNHWSNTGTADNLAIHLYRATGEAIAPFEFAGDIYTLPVTGTTATFDAFVAYWKTGTGAPTQGSLKSRAVVTVDYD